MKRFILKVLILMVVNIVIYNVIMYLLYNKSFLESACTAPRNGEYDFLLMGTSHTQVFYDHIVEKIIQKKMKNLATGAAGVVPEKIFLTCFFEANNKTNQVIYFLDPWALYSSRWNEDNYILQQEGIEYSYLSKLIENKVSTKVVFNYFRDKLTDNSDKFMRELLMPKTISPEKIKPVENLQPDNKEIPSEDSAKVEAGKREARMAQKTPEEQQLANQAEDKQRLEISYNEGLSDKNFSKYSKHVEQIILLAKKNDAAISFIIPPTLMGEMPGHDNVIKLLSELKKKYKTEYFDFALEMQKQEFYWDREHLNVKGVEYFTQNYLKDLVK
ncbi:MAG: hypothetical protein HYW62_02185 [Candidatus Levybacteria bacterium]|nr:hypothetical protein [Candidatus Levybacteria bacterium]